MKLRAQLAGEEHEISLGLRETFASVEVDGNRYEVEVRESSPGLYLLSEGSDVYRCLVGPVKGSKNTFVVALRGSDYAVTIVDPKRKRSGQSAGTHHPGSAEIVSPMPGKVVRVLVKAGDQVEAGTGIIVVEAMKMQNEMKSPKAGLVASINAEAGATVNAGDVLAVIE